MMQELTVVKAKEDPKNSTAYNSKVSRERRIPNMDKLTIWMGILKILNKNHLI